MHWATRLMEEVVRTIVTLHGARRRPSVLTWVAITRAYHHGHAITPGMYHDVASRSGRIGEMLRALDHRIIHLNPIWFDRVRESRAAGLGAYQPGDIEEACECVCFGGGSRGPSAGIMFITDNTNEFMIQAYHLIAARSSRGRAEAVRQRIEDARRQGRLSDDNATQLLDGGDLGVRHRERVAPPDPAP